MENKTDKVIEKKESAKDAGILSLDKGVVLCTGFLRKINQSLLSLKHKGKFIAKIIISYYQPTKEELLNLIANNADYEEYIWHVHADDQQSLCKGLKTKIVGKFFSVFNTGNVRMTLSYVSNNDYGSYFVSITQKIKGNIFRRWWIRPHYLKFYYQYQNHGNSEVLGIANLKQNNSEVKITDYKMTEEQKEEFSAVIKEDTTIRSEMLKFELNSLPNIEDWALFLTSFNTNDSDKYKSKEDIELTHGI